MSELQFLLRRKRIHSSSIKTKLIVKVAAVSKSVWKVLDFDLFYSFFIKKFDFNEQLEYKNDSKSLLVLLKHFSMHHIYVYIFFFQDKSSKEQSEQKWRKKTKILNSFINFPYA